MGDMAPGTMAAMCIIAALRYRDKTDVGQMIDVAQLDCMMAYNTNITTYFVSGKTELERQKEMDDLERNRKTIGQDVRDLGGIFKVKDGYIHIRGLRAKGIDMLRKKLGAEDLTKESLKKYLESLTREEAVKFFVEIDFPVAPVLYASEVTRDPQVHARNLVVEVEHPKLGKINVINFPVKLSETPGEVISAAPLLGQNNREILMKYLQYSEETVNQLENDGVIVSTKA